MQTYITLKLPSEKKMENIYLYKTEVQKFRFSVLNRCFGLFFHWVVVYAAQNLSTDSSFPKWRSKKAA